jgi:hypothetical protein
MTASCPLSEVDLEGSLLSQLHSLHAERERLFRRLGVSSNEEIVEKVERLETQLRHLRSLHEEAA